MIFRNFPQKSFLRIKRKKFQQAKAKAKAKKEYRESLSVPTKPGNLKLIVLVGLVYH